MIDLRKIAAALAFGLVLGLALAAAATPALAKQRAAHPGYAARAQVPGDDNGGLITSGPRAQALRECNDQVAPFKDYTWGVDQDQRYRACMTQHDQPE